MMSLRLIRTAVGFFVIGVVLGAYMGAAQDLRFVHVHAHVNLLGWVALGLIGLLYALHPQLQRGWMPHDWLHTLGLVLFMGAFAWGDVSGSKSVPWIAGGASAVSLGVLLLAVHVFARLRAPADLHYR